MKKTGRHLYWINSLNKDVVGGARHATYKVFTGKLDRSSEVEESQGFSVRYFVCMPIDSAW